MRIRSQLASVFPVLFFCHQMLAGVTGTVVTSPPSNINLTAEGGSDWIHWGHYTGMSFERKGCVAPQISHYALVTASYVYSAYQVTGGSTLFSWEDGLYTRSVTNTATGVYMTADTRLPTFGQGFEFTVPADTTPKTLKVHVGAFATRGQFQATLSDEPFNSYSHIFENNASGTGPNAVYTIDFSANSPGQTLTIRWLTYFEPPGIPNPQRNVALLGATLSVLGSNQPPYATITSPLPYTTNAAPANFTVIAQANDLDGSVAQVDFYDGTNKIGEATSAPYTIDWSQVPPGLHTLKAVVTDNQGATCDSPLVEVFVHTNGGSLAGSMTFPFDLSVNLTSQGTLDWAEWGYSTSNLHNRKSGVMQFIPNFTQLGTNPIVQYSATANAHQPVFSWTDGTPLASASGISRGIYVTGYRNGYELRIPADRASRRLNLYVGMYACGAMLQAFLTDFSAPAYVTNLNMMAENAWGSYPLCFQLDFAASRSGETLIVRFLDLKPYDSLFGNVNLQGATLSGPPMIFLTNPHWTAEGFSLSLAASENGRAYTIEYANALTNAFWDILTNFSGNGSSMSITDPTPAPGGAERYYRARSP